MANQIWIFDIHNPKMTSKSRYEKIFYAFAPYCHDDENHIDSLMPSSSRMLGGSTTPIKSGSTTRTKTKWHRLFAHLHIEKNTGQIRYNLYNDLRP